MPKESVLLAWVDKRLIAIYPDNEFEVLQQACLKQVLELGYGDLIAWETPDETAADTESHESWQGTWRGFVFGNSQPTSIIYTIEAVELHTLYSGFNHTPLKPMPHKASKLEEV
jgi:hypothetical protein